MPSKSAYAQAGVDYSKMGGFKEIMVAAGRGTLRFPGTRQVVVLDVPTPHGAVYQYVGRARHAWCKTQEGLGNLNWIAEWMYRWGNPSYYDRIARAAGLIIAIDVIAQGAMPVIWVDEVAAGDSEWFTDTVRATDYARGCVELCREVGMALPAGESSALKYLVKAEPPVKSCPTLSGAITGIITPTDRLISGKVEVGDRILAAPSTGIHANGISLLIKKTLGLDRQFLSELPSGRKLGEVALTPIPSYVKLVDMLLTKGIKIRSILPATGGGVAKLAVDKRSLTYRVHSWFSVVPEIFPFMEHELQIGQRDMLTTFNAGAGIYFFMPEREVMRAISVAEHAGYKLKEVGVVEEGPRQTVFDVEGAGLILPPPEE